MRSCSDVARTGALVVEGFNDCQISRRTGIPRSTVREWRVSRRWTTVGPSPASCEACGAPAHDFEGLVDSYSYLLGLYLGDGCLSRQPRDVYRLRVVLDSRYPKIIAECEQAMKVVLPRNRPGVQQKLGENAVEVGISSKQLPCLFPQHAPGRKHERPIVLSSWQQRHVERHPGIFVRGLIHSDGCRFMNTVRHGSKAYKYPRYNFTNRSEDIRRIFCDACDLLGIEWRVMNAWNISVARRGSVARLDQFVGPKA